MIGSRSWKWVSAFFLVIILQVSASTIANAKTKEAYFAGKDTNGLTLVENCQICLGGGFPRLGKFIILGGSTAVAGGILLGREEKNPVASEIRP